MVERIKRYKPRFAGAISIFGIAAFVLLYPTQWNLGSVPKPSDLIRTSADRCNCFEFWNKLLISSYSGFGTAEYHSKIVLEPEKPDVRNQPEAVRNTELVTNSINTKIQNTWELPHEETHSTNNLEVTGAWEAGAELTLIEETEISNREKVANLEIETGNGSQENEKKSAIKRQNESNNLSKSDFLNRNPVTTSTDFSNQKSEKETVDRVSNPNPDRVLKNRTSKTEVEVLERRNEILNLESKVNRDLLDSASWETETDSFAIRILENINIEKWAWNHIREKLDEIKNKTFKNNAPSLFANGKEMLLYFPRRDESRRKNQPKPNKQDFVFQNPDNTHKNSDYITFNRSLEVPNVNRKQMRYYAIQTSGPPPTDHKQV